MNCDGNASSSAEICHTLSSLCKVSSDGIPPSDTVVYGMEGAEIRHVLYPQNIFKEIKYCRVFIRHSDYKVGWVLNDAVHNCMLCHEPFGILLTRHHCRACGCIACTECCSQKVSIKQLPGIESRVCDVCAAKHSPDEVWDVSAAEEQFSYT